MLSRSRIVPLAVVALMVAAFAAEPAFGCPRCKDTLNGNEATAWFWSIIGMASAPFLIGGTVLGMIFRSCRKAQRPG